MGYVAVIVAVFFRIRLTGSEHDDQMDAPVF